MKKIVLFIVAMIMACSMNFAYAAGKAKTPPSAGEIIAASLDTIHGDVKGAVSTVYNDSKEFLGDIYPDVKNAVIAIGKAIGVAAEHVYNVLVKKYVVEGVKYLLIFVGGLILLIIGGVSISKHIKASKPITYALIMPALCLIVGFFMIVNIDYDAMLMGLINPEYGAINYILEYSKELIK